MTPVLRLLPKQTLVKPQHAPNLRRVSLATFHRLTCPGQKRNEPGAKSGGLELLAVAASQHGGGQLPFERWQDLRQNQTAHVAGSRALFAPARRPSSRDGQAKFLFLALDRRSTCAKTPNEALAKDSPHPAPEQIGLDPHISQATECARAIVRVESRQAARPDAPPTTRIRSGRVRDR